MKNKKYLEDKIKVITKAEVIELFKNEFDVDLEDYSSYEVQYSSYDSENYSCRSEVDDYGGEGQGEERWNISRIVDKRTREVFFIRFDGYYESWNGSDWSNNDWCVVVPKEVKVIKWL